MKKQRSTITKILIIAIPIILTILWLGFIYSNSLKTGVESGEQSGRVHQIVSNITHSLGIDLTISEKLIRKGAHFTEFAVLSILLCFDLTALGFASLQKKLYVSSLFLLASIPLSAIFASADEILQNFSDGRGPSFSDVLIDVSGAITATLIFIVFFSLCKSVFTKHVHRLK